MRIPVLIFIIIFLAITAKTERFYDTLQTDIGTIIVEKLSIFEGEISSTRNYLVSEGFSIDLPFKERWKYLHGFTEEYYRNGKLSSRTHYNKGKIISPDTCWHKNGAISIINTYNENNNMHGTIKYYNDNGTFGGEKKCFDGKDEGPFILLYNNGNKKQQGNYQNDTKHGWWRNWFEDGTLKDSTLYNNDYIKESFIYFKNGQLSTHTWVLTIESDSLANDEHFLMLEDSYTMDGKLVSQVRNGNGYTHFFDWDGNYTSLMNYKNGMPENLVSFLSEIPKEKLIETKDPRYPPKEIPKKRRLSFDVKKYGKLLKEQ